MTALEGQTSQKSDNLSHRSRDIQHVQFKISVKVQVPSTLVLCESTLPCPTAPPKATGSSSLPRQPLVREKDSSKKEKILKDSKIENRAQVPGTGTGNPDPRSRPIDFLWPAARELPGSKPRVKLTILGTWDAVRALKGQMLGSNHENCSQSDSNLLRGMEAILTVEGRTKA